MSNLSRLEAKQQAIFNALQPIKLTIPKKLQQYRQINTTPNRKIKYFTNPITGSQVKNVSANRKRIYKQILFLNEKAQKQSEVIQELKQQNYKNSLISKVDLKKAFKNALFYYLKLNNIDSYDELFDIIQLIIKKTGGENGMMDFFIDSIAFYFEDGEGIIKAFNIDNSYYLTENERQIFKNKLDSILTGEAVGSDVLGENYQLLFDKIDIIFKTDIPAFDTPKYMIYENVNINEYYNDKVDCINNCMKYLINECNLNYENQSELQQIKNMTHLMNYITLKKLPIRIISNFITDLEFSKNNISVNIDDKNTILYKLNECKYKEDILYMPKNKIFDFTLIFCSIGEHLDVIINNKPIIKNDIYISSRRNVYKLEEKGYKMLYDSKKKYNVIKETKGIEDFETSYIFFDYEAITDNLGIFKPYSISFYEIQENLLKLLMKEKNPVESLNCKKQFKLNKSKCVNYCGFDCNLKFINWVKENEINKRFVFVGFNSSNYDNIIMFNQLMKDKEINISNTIHIGNSVLNSKINGRHSFFDLRRHLTGSLKYNCESFDVPEEFAKIELEFSHNQIQNYYNTNNEEEFIKYMNNKDAIEYNNNDVLCLAHIFIQYRIVFLNISSLDFMNHNFCDNLTIGSVIQKSFKNNCINKKITLGKLNYKQYKDILKYRTAGRVEIFSGKPVFIKGEIVSMDVCSLYPYIMSIAPNYYPCGEKKDTDIYIEDKIGYYYCDIDQRAFKKHNLPNYIAEKTETENKWDSQEILKDYLISNITIELLKKYENIGVKCEIKKGFYYTEKIKGCELFSSLIEIMKLKNEQDKYKKDKDSKYNPALRETLKLLMNSLSGKVAEGFHLDKIAILKDDAEELIKLNKHGKVNIIGYIEDKLIASYKINEEKQINKQKPIQLSAILYEYARKFMYENAYSIIGLDKCIYTDTDAIKMLKSDFETIWKPWAIKQNVPHFKEIEEFDDRYKEHKLYNEKSKVFGSFENELSTNNFFYALQKKFWLVGNINEKGEITYIKTSFKGINTNSLIIPKENNSIVLKTYKKEGIFELEEECNLLKERETVFNWIMDNNKSTIGGNYDKSKNEGFLGKQVELFETLYKEGKINVLCNNFSKCLKNSNRNVNIDDVEKFNKNSYTISLKYMLKTITL